MKAFCSASLKYAGVHRSCWDYQPKGSDERLSLMWQVDGHPPGLHLHRGEERGICALQEASVDHALARA